MSSIGQQIIDAIIAGELVSAECPDSPERSCVLIWSANVYEQIDQMVADYDPAPDDGKSPIVHSARKSQPFDSAVIDWLESAPDVAKAWLRGNIETLNAIVKQRNESFQAIGCYDGSMSEECKAGFRARYEFLSKLAEWCKEKNERGE